ncbi:MAG: VCBS repeat-containing protein [Verrucomicrobiae bacterium]|nr:VCBS repeat-containing protein [Verrucomicrobiae bacterium]
MRPRFLPSLFPGLSLTALLSLPSLESAPPAGLPRFEAQVIDEAVEIGYGLAIGDVDGDGKPDVLLCDKREISWFRNPDWSERSIVKNLSLRDHVCLAAADLDGDGKVEIAAGAQWNPGETTDKAQSGAVFYLVRPESGEGPWKPVPLYHDPTTHRMRWVPTPSGHELVVLPLHGIGNKDGAGPETVKVRRYRVDPAKAGEADSWSHEVLGTAMHVTHNLDVRDGYVYIGGAEGIRRERAGADESTVLVTAENSTPPTRGVGEIAKGADFIAAIEPFHGNDLVVYREAGEGKWSRTLLTDSLNQGHAVSVADFNADGLEDVVVGWRNPDAEGHVGVKIFFQKPDGEWYPPFWVARDAMATEDLKVVDLDGDGRLDIVASGRSSKNLVIFWNRK